jgi:hypothetical protein
MLSAGFHDETGIVHRGMEGSPEHFHAFRWHAGRSQDTTGTGHVLNDDMGFAGNMIGEEWRERTRVASVPAARICAQDPRYLAAPVKTVVGMGRAWNRKRDTSEENRPTHGAVMR